MRRPGTSASGTVPGNAFLAAADAGSLTAGHRWFFDTDDAILFYVARSGGSTALNTVAQFDNAGVSVTASPVVLTLSVG